MRYLTMPILVVVALMLSTAPVHADLGDQVFKLLPEDGAPTDWFGMSVAISGTVGIGGAPFHVHKDVHPGSAYLFNTTTGKQIAELLPNDADGSDWFGWSVAISGTKALVGAIAAGNGGFEAAFIFDISDPTNPIQILQLLSEDGVEDDAFGWSVAISGDIAIVGARLDDDNGTSSGSAYLFDTTTGEQIAKLLPNDGAEAEEFGWSVAINGAIAIVGAADNNQLDIGTDTGAVYFFNTTTGQQITKLLPIDNKEGDQFGNSVAISGNTAIIGAYGDDSAYLFDISSPFNPVQIAKLLPDDGVANGNFGWSVAISDATAIVGAPSDDDNGPGSGSAYLFDSTSGQQITKLLAEDGALQDHFGHSVAISGTTAIISAPIDDDNGLSSGSAYIFEGVGILRVDVDAPPGGDGLSWGTAYRFIQDALADAAASGGVDEIRAAQGTYKPDQSEANPSGTGNRETKFQMLHGLALVGGYAGIGAKDPNVRDYELYQTILSGDIGEIDLIDDNSYHVISASGANQTVLLDGLVLTRGFANSSPPHNRGAGLIIDNGIAEVANCTFLNNWSLALGDQVAAGAAISSSASNLILTNCTFISNAVSGSSDKGILGGGAISASNSSITGSNCRFISNRVRVHFNTGPTQGGAIRASSSTVLTLTDCLFIDNSAFSENINGRSGTGGGMYIWSSTASFTNCIFVGNEAPGASWGAGIYAIEADVALVNCLLHGNIMDGNGLGAGIYATNSNISATNCAITENRPNGFYLDNGSVLSAANSILWRNGFTGLEERQIDLDNGSSATINYSNVEGWTGQFGGTGNIGENPLFVGGPSGTWTEDAIAGSGPGETVYTDSNASFAADAFFGATIQPDGPFSQHAFIIDNTATTITVWGSKPFVFAGDSYEIFDSHFQLDSPCIDAADNSALPGNINTDLDGNPRYFDDPFTKDTGIGDPPIVDMGAYEFQGLLCPWDLDNSGSVGTSDLLALFAQWGTAGSADFDESGDVGTNDLLILFANWGPCK